LTGPRVETVLWTAFGIVVVSLMALDLGVFHRRPRAVNLREAALWTGIWVSSAILFCLGVYFLRGSKTALEFLAGYLIEESLSLDNMFVFVAVFQSFRVRDEHQHQVLFWGILGALIFRAIFIVAGTALLARLHWAVYVLGVVLIVTAVRIGFVREKEKAPAARPPVTGRLVPVVADTDAGRFFVRREGRLAATPLFLALLSIEAADIAFAIDSVPAVLAVSRDPLVVYTSNVFAILGLRSLYFLVVGLIGRMRYLKPGLAVLLAFVGVKMLLSEHVEIPVAVALGVVVGIMGTAVAASLLLPGRPEAGRRPHLEPTAREAEGDPSPP